MNLRQRWKQTSLANQLLVVIGLPGAIAAIVGVYYAREAAHQDQRAWVHVNKQALWGKGPIVVGLDLSNTGKTPAFNLVSRVMVTVDQIPILPMPATVEPAKPIVMHPGQPLTLKSAPLSLNADQAAAFNAGQTRIYVRTLICYDDAFGTRHWVTTCASHGVTQLIDDFELCQTGNQAGTDGLRNRTCTD